MADPLPCPFCGGTALLTYGPDALVACRACGAYGPFCAHARAYTWDSRHGGPLTSHGYRPEHGDPLAWAAEMLDTVTTGADASNEEVFRLMDEVEDLNRKLTQARNDVATAAALNTTLLDALRASGESFSVRRWILERIFGKG